MASHVYDFPELQRWIYRPAQDEMVSLLRSRDARRVADIACGTGILADRIERELRPDQVFGVDMSEGMLARATERSSQVQWLRSPAEQLPFGDGALDAVVTTTAFHFFDQPAALREFHRVLAPGGVAAVATFSSSLPDWVQRLTTNRVSPAHGPSPAEMRSLFEGAGFVVSDQHPVSRAPWTRVVLPDLITVGDKT